MQLALPRIDRQVKTRKKFQKRGRQRHRHGVVVVRATGFPRRCAAAASGKGQGEDRFHRLAQRDRHLAVGQLRIASVSRSSRAGFGCKRRRAGRPSAPAKVAKWAVYPAPSALKVNRQDPEACPGLQPPARCRLRFL